MIQFTTFRLGKQTVENYNNFLASLIGTSGLDHILITVLALALDWQWDDYLSTQLPQCYIDELQGIHDGAKSIGIEDDVAKISKTQIQQVFFFFNLIFQKLKKFHEQLS